MRNLPYMWFDEASYARVRAVSVDKEHLPEKFSEWLDRHKTMFDQIKRSGIPVYKFFIDADDLVAWAAGRPIDQGLRAGFTLFIAEQEDRADEQ